MAETGCWWREGLMVERGADGGERGADGGERG